MLSRSKFEMATFILMVLGLLMLAPLAAHGKTKKSAASKFSLRPANYIPVARGGAQKLQVIVYAGSIHLGRSRDRQVWVHASKVGTGQGSQPDLFKNLLLQSGVSDGALMIRTTLPPQKDQWMEWARSSVLPQIELDVLVPDGLPTEVLLLRGSVQAANVRSRLDLVETQGDVKVVDCSGPVRVRVQKGNVKVSDISAAVSIDSFAGSTQTSDTGPLRLNQFAGQAVVSKSNGGLDLWFHKTKAVIKNSSGPVDLNGDGGTYKIVDHEGPVHGHVDSANVTASISSPDPQVKLTSVSGRLSVILLRSAATSVHLASSKGLVRGPASLQHRRSATGQLVIGSIGKGGGNGSIRLISESGEVALKGH